MRVSMLSALKLDGNTTEAEGDWEKLGNEDCFVADDYISVYST